MTTAILRDPRAPSKPAPIPHDPVVCGLTSGSDCDACRARAERAQRELWERDAEARERSRLREIRERLADTTGIPLADLVAVLLPHLAEPVAEIVGAVLDERGSA